MEQRFSVYVRTRPLIREDYTGREAPAVCVQHSGGALTICLAKPLYDDREFTFDRVLEHCVGQAETFKLVAQRVVDSVLAGYNGTVLGYGQTGSGKTYTMFGPLRAVELYGESLHSEHGVVPRSVEHIFTFIQEHIEETQFQVTVTFLQIYMETVTDLLAPHNKKPLQIREDSHTGIFVSGLTQKTVRSAQQLNELIREAARTRVTCATSMNETSSRSHAVLQIFVEQRWVEPPKQRKGKRGLLTLVDLAGNERLSKSGSEGLRLSEVKNINKSIAALGNCVAALASAATRRSTAHVPFRDSKLTRLLTDSLGGNSRTCLCACIGPSAVHYEETFSTLLFAKRAMKVKTYAQLNESAGFEGIVMKNQELQENNLELRQELEVLRSKMRVPSTLRGDSSLIGSSLLSDCQCGDKQKELVGKFTRMVQFLQSEIARLNIVVKDLQDEKGGTGYGPLIEKLLSIPGLKGELSEFLSNSM